MITYFMIHILYLHQLICEITLGYFRLPKSLCQNLNKSLQMNTLHSCIWTESKQYERNEQPFGMHTGKRIFRFTNRSFCRFCHQNEMYVNVGALLLSSGRRVVLLCFGSGIKINCLCGDLCDYSVLQHWFSLNIWFKGNNKVNLTFLHQIFPTYMQLFHCYCCCFVGFLLLRN